MAKQTWNSGSVTIGGTQYAVGASTSLVASVTVDASVEELDTTDMDDGGVRKREAGLKDGSCQIGFKWDGDLTTYKTIADLLGTDVAIAVKGSSASTAASEPEAQFNVLVTQIPSFGGSVGALFESSVTWPLTTAVTFATS